MRRVMAQVRWRFIGPAASRQQGTIGFD